MRWLGRTVSTGMRIKARHHKAELLALACLIKHTGCWREVATLLGDAVTPTSAATSELRGASHGPQSASSATASTSGGGGGGGVGGGSDGTGASAQVAHVDSNSLDSAVPSEALAAAWRSVVALRRWLRTEKTMMKQNVAPAWRNADGGIGESKSGMVGVCVCLSVCGLSAHFHTLSFLQLAARR